MAKTTVIFVLLLLQSVAHAEARSVSLIAAGSCPSSDALRGAVREAMPDLLLVDGDLAESVVVVEDHGEQYHVRTANGVRVLTDAARRCDDRAKSAAVVIGLLIDINPARSMPIIVPAPPAPVPPLLILEPAAPSRRSGTPLKIAGFSLLGTAVLAITGGIVAMALSTKYAGDAAAGNMFHPDAALSHHAAIDASISLFVLGSAHAVAGAICIGLGYRQDNLARRRSHAQLKPQFGPTYAGASVSFDL